MLEQGENESRTRQPKACWAEKKRRRLNIGCSLGTTEGVRNAALLVLSRDPATNCGQLSKSLGNNRRFDPEREIVRQRTLVPQATVPSQMKNPRMAALPAMKDANVTLADLGFADNNVRELRFWERVPDLEDAATTYRQLAAPFKSQRASLALVRRCA
jgi:hypothetical protein